MNATTTATNGDALGSGATLLHATLQRLASQSASCKLWSVALASVVFIMAAGRTGAEVLVWAAAPLAWLALADAAYAAQARRFAALARNSSVTIGEVLQLQVAGASLSGAGQSMLGLLSFSVWPFYASLAALVVVLGHWVLIPQARPVPTSVVPTQTFPAPSSQGRPMPPGRSNMSSPQPFRSLPNNVPPSARAPFPPPASASPPPLAPWQIRPRSDAPGRPPMNRPATPAPNSPASGASPLSPPPSSIPPSPPGAK